MQLKEEAQSAARAFEDEAKKVKAHLYEEFSKKVSEDKSLHKFWKLYASMNRAKKHTELPDFRREDDEWVRSDEEKGTALFERYLEQTDQRNADSRKELLQSLQISYGSDLRWPFMSLDATRLSHIINHASDSAPGPDGGVSGSLCQLGEMTLADAPLSTCLVSTCLSAISWPDSPAASKACALVELILPRLVDQSSLSQEDASSLMMTVLKSFQDMGHHEANNIALTHLGLNCYELLRPKYPGVREIFNLIPNSQPEDLVKFDNKVMAGMKGGEKVRRIGAEPL